MDMNLGLQRLLIRCADTGELGDLALARLLVKSLGVTLLGDFHGDVDPDLDEWQAGLTAGTFGLVQFARKISVCAVGADEACDGDRAGVREQFGHLGDAADVLLAVFGREAEILVQTEPDVVAVQAVGGFAVGFAKQGLFESHGNGGFAARRETCQPDCQALLLAETGANIGRQRRRVVVDVAGTFVSICLVDSYA